MSGDLPPVVSSPRRWTGSTRVDYTCRYLEGSVRSSHGSLSRGLRSGALGSLNGVKENRGRPAGMGTVGHMLKFFFLYIDLRFLECHEFSF